MIIIIILAKWKIKQFESTDFTMIKWLDRQIGNIYRARQRSTQYRRFCDDPESPFRSNKILFNIIARIIFS